MQSKKSTDLTSKTTPLIKKLVAWNETTFLTNDFLKPPDPLLPYITTRDGDVLELHVSKPKGENYPEDRQQWDVSVQTDTPDVADTTLVNFEADEIHDRTTPSHKHHRTESGLDSDGCPSKRKK
ncbi:hypothetical protein EI94DRAFT_1701148 [Lactarius quietus]|nr:hypothetical protein EI94DRAFT_1701148 [Lactarius quietus]